MISDRTFAESRSENWKIAFPGQILVPQMMTIFGTTKLAAMLCRVMLTSALLNLRQAINLNLECIETAKNDSDFERIRANESFRGLIADNNQ